MPLIALTKLLQEPNRVGSGGPPTWRKETFMVNTDNIVAVHNIQKSTTQPPLLTRLITPAGDLMVLESMDTVATIFAAATPQYR